ncbi:MAG: acyl-CoA dehydrogenase [Hyphomicrobiales bacterium]|nr:acyl-CoA dehydrogenase [Hyphomicrobiales bacterium]
MAYRAPVSEMVFMMNAAAGLQEGIADGVYADLADGMAEATLNEAAKYAENVLGPLHRVGDQVGCKWADGVVTTPPGWVEAYAQFVEGGWQSVTGSPEHGGMGLPQVLLAGCMDMWSAANMAFLLGPVLTFGAIDALEAHASDEIKHTYLEKMISGVWPATMNLTEPGAGSDLNPLRTRAERQGDGTYKIFGQKIFITYGDHDLAENIIHLVLARLPDAPAGVKGISLFVVPKFHINRDGTLGARNDVRCVSIEHKLGIHASPTCTLSFGDAGGAIGHLVGEPNRGLQYMFAMMNNARLNVGIQGIGIAERAGQGAAAYAAERRQGAAPGAEGPVAIIEHPDVRRMLGLIRARTEAARAIACRAAAALDQARLNPDPDLRARYQRRVDLMIPVVKGWSTEMGILSASLGVQVHGGMGYVEETGAAQHLRDVRITTIYEGTTGIQALDLVGRKLIRDNGTALAELVEAMRASLDTLDDGLGGGTDWAAHRQMLADAIGALEAATEWLVARAQSNQADPQAAATATLDLFGICLGAWAMADSAVAAARRLQAGENAPHLRSKLRIAEFYRSQIFPQAAAARAAAEGAAAVLALGPEDFGVAV